MFNIIMLGPQGAGKGTQAEFLADKLEIPTVSVGKLFRLEMEKDTGLGQAIGKFVNAGDRVPPDMVDQVMTERLSEDDTEKGLILDGYPRTKDQITNLEKILKDMDRVVTHVVYLKVPDEVSLRRLSGRRVCSNLKCEENYHVDFNPPKKDPAKCDKCGSALIQRADDTPEAIKHRLELYHQDTEPIVEFYRAKGQLHEVDGTKSIRGVREDIEGIFS